MVEILGKRLCCVGHYCGHVGRREKRTMKNGTCYSGTLESLLKGKNSLLAVLDNTVVRQVGTKTGQSKMAHATTADWNHS